MPPEGIISSIWKGDTVYIQHPAGNQPALTVVSRFLWELRKKYSKYGISVSFIPFCHCLPLFVRWAWRRNRISGPPGPLGDRSVTPQTDRLNT